MSVLTLIGEAVIAGDAEKTTEGIEKAIAEGFDAGTILEGGLIAGMNVLGIRFKNNEVYIPEVLIAARAMQFGLDVLQPLLVSSGVQSKGTFVIGTVQSDLHDIGKNLVIMMFKGAGFNVIDLGIDVSIEKFIAAVDEHKPQVVGVSALLTTTMSQMQQTVEKLKAHNKDVKIIIGGAPVTQQFADKIGADGYGADATSAVDKALELLASA
jgi:5-methyltetrahydrofolate--homocysteine methyltransferase